MKNFSLKALGAFIFAAGLVVAGVAAPAQAAPGVTIDSPVPTFYENSASPAFSLTLEHTGTIPTGTGPIQLTINSFTPLAGCSASPVSVPSASCGITSVVAAGGGSLTSPTVQKMAGDLKFDWTGTTSAITISFAAGAYNTSTSGTKTVTARVQGTPYTTTITVASGVAPPSSSSVTFNSNGGSGAMSDQSASTATALSANAFTRSGYTFAGWNTAADGSGTAYADGASYAFSSSVTLYAQWTASLANTGVNPATGISLLVGGLSLALVGAEMFMIARRKRINS